MEEKKLRSEIDSMQKPNPSPEEIKALDGRIEAFQQLQRQRKTPAQMRDEVEVLLENYLETNRYFRDAGNKVIKVDENRLKTDWRYNVEVGMSLLRDSYEFAKSHVPKNRDGSQNRDELFKMTYLYYHLGENNAKRYVSGQLPGSDKIKSVIDRVFETRYKPTHDRVQN